MLEVQLDGILPSFLEVNTLQLHLEDESLVEQGSGVELTLVACFEVKRAEIPGVERVTDENVLTIHAKASTMSSLAHLVLGAPWVAV